MSPAAAGAGQFQWLNKLTLAKLHRIAVSVGSPCSGTKAARVAGIRHAIENSNSVVAVATTTTTTTKDQETRAGAGVGAEGTRDLSLLSIDMGIRNLAFAHITAPASAPTETQRDRNLQYDYYGTPTLREWRRVEVASALTSGSLSPSSSLLELSESDSESGLLGDSGSSSSSNALPASDATASAAAGSEQPTVPDASATTGASAAKPKKKSKKSKSPSSSLLPAAETTLTKEKESFEPIDYAHHAYHLITSLLQTYKPTHILIERQRFRSGGRAAVPEWTIRVGVFEGMLYAVLRTLVEQGKVDVLVEPVQPAFVNRYWLERTPSDSGMSMSIDKSQNSESESAGTGGARSGRGLSGRETKRAKIDLVGRILTAEQKDHDHERPVVFVNKDLEGVTAQFLSIWQKDKKVKVKRKSATGKGTTTTATASISKLDDLADSLLQGLAWIHWQNARRRLHALGREGVEEGVGAER
ncbi:hypothetical protein ABEF95_004748 [Exophiala dermatitidis]